MIVDARQNSLLYDTNRLVTPIARQLSRLMREERGSSSEFDSITYASEIILKFECTVMLGILQVFDPGEASRLGYAIATNDGVGIWADTLQKVINGLTVAGKLETLEFTRNYTQKLGSDARGADILESARSVWFELGESDASGFAKNRLGILQFFVALRNRTRGHGATTPSQYEAINPPLLEILSWLVETSSFASGDLLKPMKIKSGGNYSCRLLRGYPSQIQELLPAESIKTSEDLYIRIGGSVLQLPDFIYYVRDDDSSYFLNSRRKSSGASDYLDYLTNEQKPLILRWFHLQPTERQPSRTAGRNTLDWDATPINNLPTVDFTTYVRRPSIEKELLEFLTGKAVNFISLAGLGGAGKTTLALRVVRQIINQAQSASEGEVFDVIIWFSARDVDLDEYAGPLARQRQVTSLSACAQMFCDLIEPLYAKPKELTPADFMASCLSSAKEKYLLVFDNFESFDDTPTLQEFVKRHLAHPSKALITSRERAFQGDFKIEIGGLSLDQTRDLIMQTARRAGCEPRVDEKLISRIYDLTLGNPYAIKLVINEFARSSSLDKLLPKVLSEDYLTALFRRSFERADDDAQYLFLLLALSPSARDERMAHLCCAGRSVDYQRARDAILDNHLLDSPDEAGSEYGVFRVSWAAQQFAKQIIVGTRVQRDVERDVTLLRILGREGVGPDRPAALMRFLSESADAADPQDFGAQQRNKRVIEYILEHDAEAAEEYALTARAAGNLTADDQRRAYKRAVELDPAQFQVWISWASFEQAEGDHQRALDLSLRALDHSDRVETLTRVGRQIITILTDFKEFVPVHRRAIYTRSVLARLEIHHDDLEADGLGVLGWLYLISGETSKARKCAEDCLSRFPENPECSRLRSRVDMPAPRRSATRSK